MATVQLFRVAATGSGQYNADWTAANQRAALMRIREGQWPDGSPVEPGTYPFHGQTLTITPVSETRDQSRSDNNNVNSAPPGGSAGVSFTKGAKCKRLASDALTERSGDGRIVRKTADNITNLLADIAQMINNEGVLISANEHLRNLVAYSNDAQALGRLKTSEFLVLPSDMPTPVVPATEVGTGLAKDKFTVPYVLAVYALNKEVHTATDEGEKIKFAMIRMEAVILGWVSDQREIRFAPTPANFIDVVSADSERMSSFAESAAMAAWLVPFAAEHVFRTTGHHFLTNLASTYTTKYDKVFKACLAPELSKYLAPDVMYRKALRWVSPGRVWEILSANLNEDRIPEAIRIRANSAPSGTALITTTSAVLNAMKSTKVCSKMEEMQIADFAKIMELDANIRANPPKFHKVPEAYGRPALTHDEKANLEAAKREAAKLAPVTKAFVDSMLRQAPLGRQQVLNKYAKMNPTVYEKCKRFFISLKRICPATIEEALEGLAMPPA